MGADSSSDDQTMRSPRVDAAEPLVEQEPAPTSTSRMTAPVDPRLVEEADIGRGGMAVVRRAYDQDLMRTVAIKRLDPALADSPVARDRLVEEAQITAQLDHPNIVPVHELQRDGAGTPYIVMKLVGGRTLGEVLADESMPREPETLRDLLEIFLKVCDAMAFAHSRGVVHCDLKPRNVMVDGFGRIYVVDWGLARTVGVETELGARAASQRERERDGGGTVRYMAPEQAKPKWRAIDARTDVFALGAILYEMLTGRAPHGGDTPLAVRTSAFECVVPPPEEVLGEGVVPPALSRIAMKAMQREPRDRFPTATAVKLAVERFLHGSEQFATRTFPPGALVVREGDLGDAAYVIAHGRARAFKTVDAQVRVLREMGPGEVFGETAVFSNKPRTASVEAIDELVVREVRASSIQEGLGLHTWMGAFVRTLAERFREVDERLTALEHERDSRDE